MLDTIMNAVKGQAISMLTEKTGVGAEQAEQAVPMAKDSITDGITNAMGSGNLGGILDMVKQASGSGASAGSPGGLLQNTVYQGIATNFIGKLTGKLGLSPAIAQQVSTYVLPMIMSKLAGKTQEAGDTNDIDQGSLLSTLGLDAGGLLGKAGDLLGGGNKGQSGGGLGGALGSFLK